MINFDEFEKVLEYSGKAFIKAETLITMIEIEQIHKLIEKHGLTTVLLYVEKLTNNSRIDNKSFIVESTCKKCRTSINLSLSKTKFTQYIKAKTHSYICTTCYNIQQHEEQLKKENEKLLKIQADKEKLETLNNNTTNYIQEYLNPEKCWTEKISLYNKIQYLRYADVNWNYISSYIKQMNYYEFLKTPYWKAITLRKMKDAGFKCQLCNTSGVKLSTHHRTYSIHGDELHNFGDLIVLCEKCHEKHHDIEPKKNIDIELVRERIREKLANSKYKNYDEIRGAKKLDDRYKKNKESNEIKDVV